MLYNRFTTSIDLTKEKVNSSQAIDTFGASLTFGLYWTSFIRPDFKEDYFLARLFFGVSPYYCFIDKIIVKKNGQEKFRVDCIDTAAKATGNDAFKYKSYKFSFIAGQSFEFPNGLLVEFKGIFPYNFSEVKEVEKCDFMSSFHISLGYNFAKLAEN